MSNFLTIDVLKFRVVNRNTGKEYEYDSFEAACQAIDDLRKYQGEGARYEMVAVVNA